MSPRAKQQKADPEPEVSVGGVVTDEGGRPVTDDHGIVVTHESNFAEAEDKEA